MQRELGRQQNRGQWEGVVVAGGMVVVGAMGSLSGMQRGEGGRGRHCIRRGKQKSGKVLEGAKRPFGCKRSEPSFTNAERAQRAELPRWIKDPTSLGDVKIVIYPEPELAEIIVDLILENRLPRRELPPEEP